MICPLPLRVPRRPEEDQQAQRLQRGAAEEVDRRKQTGLSGLKIQKIYSPESVRGKKPHNETGACHPILAPPPSPPPLPPPPWYLLRKAAGCRKLAPVHRPTAATCQNHVTPPAVTRNRVTVARGSANGRTAHMGWCDSVGRQSFWLASGKEGRPSGTTGRSGRTGTTGRSGRTGTTGISGKLPWDRRHVLHGEGENASFV